MARLLQNPRGTKDILPDEQKYWQYIFDIVKTQMGIFGAGRIETPIFEFAETYVRSIGKGTDIIDKEMFGVRRISNFESDNSNEEDSRIMVLRPEYTAGIMRSYIQNGMDNLPQPVKLWYFGPAFRYERPQAGRYRIHNQFGVEVIGDSDSLTDVAVIFLAIETLNKIGIKNIKIDINSIGCPICRPKMRKKQIEYFQNFLPDLCPDCNRRYVENPLRIFDCKETKCQRIISGAPPIIDMLCDNCKAHFKEVLENLDSLQVNYNLNPRLVRGLDYYTRTVFEFYLNDDDRNLALLGGGRYDALAPILGGKETPAIGWSAGVERIVSVLKEKEIPVLEEQMTDICLIQIGAKAKKVAFVLMKQLVAENLRVTNILGKESLKAQLRAVGKMGARIALIVGQRETMDKTAIFKDMDTGFQETVDQNKLIEFLKKKLK